MALLGRKAKRTNAFFSENAKHLKSVFWERFDSVDSIDSDTSRGGNSSHSDNNGKNSPEIDAADNSSMRIVGRKRIKKTMMYDDFPRKMNLTAMFPPPLKRTTTSSPPLRK
jgi:hypothetical protein